MTSLELAEARRRLDLTPTDLAATYGLSPEAVLAMEQGRAPVPKRMARDLTWQVALLERSAILAGSGLPECAEATRFAKQAEGQEGDELLRALEALNAHAEDCTVCRAREEYLEEQAPPLPEPPLPFWIRAIGRVTEAVGRLPRGIRPPKGEPGEGRRTGILMATGFSILAFALIGVGLVRTILSEGRLGAEWREMAAALVWIPVGYFVGFYTGGLVFDFTRPIRHRFVGYVLRGGLGAVALYGAVGLMAPLLDDEFTWGDVPIVTAGLGIIGCLIGAGLWVKHRATGKVAPSI